jgi:hypothetical protein
VKVFFAVTYAGYLIIKPYVESEYEWKPVVLTGDEGVTAGDVGFGCTGVGCDVADREVVGVSVTTGVSGVVVVVDDVVAAI